MPAVLDNLRIVQAPTYEPVSLDEARQHVREDMPADADAEDLMLPGYIRAARRYAEQLTGMILTDAVYELRLDWLCGAVPFPVAPVGRIGSVIYTDPDGLVLTLDEAVYVLDDHPTRPALRLAFGQAWPVVRCEAGGVRVRFQAPYTRAESPPVEVEPTIKQALLLLIGHWYANREDVVVGVSAGSVPMASAALLALHRLGLGV